MKCRVKIILFEFCKSSEQTTNLSPAIKVSIGGIISRRITHSARECAL